MGRNRWNHATWAGVRTGAAVILIVDHLRGARRGTREQFASFERLTIGRHPGSDVCFDGRRDIDASTRHAELVWDETTKSLRLCDLGSSNGTWIYGKKVANRSLALGESIEVEFGRGGPAVRLWLGDASSSIPPIPKRARWWRRFLRW